MPALDPESPVISVVIPCYRRSELAVNAVRSALQQQLDPGTFEVIVVDSTPDDSVVKAVEALRSEAPCRFVVLTKKAEGPGPSRNLGVANSSGTYIAFLDSDCHATPGWLAALVENFGKGIGIVQGRTMPVPWQKQGIFSHTLRIEKESFLYETANIAYLRAAFDQTGGFTADWDPTRATPLGGEDADLAWRVLRNDWRTCFAENALVYHEILPMKWVDWIWIARLQVFPDLIGRYPELRAFFFCRYFYDRAQAWVTLAVVGLALTYWWSLAFLVLVVPYIAFRASEPTRSLKGILRLARPAVYFLRDFSSLCILATSSLRRGVLLL